MSPPEFFYLLAWLQMQKSLPPFIPNIGPYAALYWKADPDYFNGNLSLFVKENTKDFFV